MIISKNFETMYDFLACEYPDVLDWCKDQARWHKCPLGAILTWKEDAIMRLMDKKNRDDYCSKAERRTDDER